MQKEMFTLYIKDLTLSRIYRSLKIQKIGFIILFSESIKGGRKGSDSASLPDFI